MRLPRLLPASLLALAPIPVLLPTPAAAQARRATAGIPTPADTEHTRHFRRRSELPSAIWGRDMFIVAGVVPPATPPSRRGRSQAGRR